MPPHHSFEPTTLEESRDLYTAYRTSIHGINDDFWERYIVRSEMRVITIDGERAGFFCIHDKENLCLFHVAECHLRDAQPIFAQVLEGFAPHYAWVLTRDEQFLSLSMDKHTRVELQAYFFKEGSLSVRPPEYGRELLALATLDDVSDILDKNPEKDILAGKYYVLRENGVFLGQGFLARNRLTPDSASVGMAVHPDHRQKGVGRSIILHMKEICHEQGLTPVCGCWHDNHNSKRTLESAGFVTQTRLLKVWLT